MDYSAIKTEIFNALRTGTGVPVYDTRVPSGAKHPFIRFYFLGTEISQEFQTGPSFRRHVIVVDVVSVAETGTEAETILGNVISTLNRFSFSKDGIRFKLGFLGTRRIHDEDTNQWLLSAEFSVHAK